MDSAQKGMRVGTIHCFYFLLGVIGLAQLHMGLSFTTKLLSTEQKCTIYIRLHSIVHKHSSWSTTVFRIPIWRSFVFPFLFCSQFPQGRDEIRLPWCMVCGPWGGAAL